MTFLLRVAPRSTLIPPQINEYRMSVCLTSTARLLHSYNEGDNEEGALTATQDRIVQGMWTTRDCLFLRERAEKSYFT